MKLKDYLIEAGLTNTDFAARLGVSKTAVGRWIMGSRIPNRALMAAIARATNGAVTPADFYADANEAA